VFVVVEIGNPARLAQQHETLAVERQPAGDGARVTHPYLMGYRAAVAQRGAGRRLIIVGEWFLGHRLEKVERGDDAVEIPYRQAVHQTLRPGMARGEVCRRFRPCACDVTIKHRGHK
jgi:hypothetical protein